MYLYSVCGTGLKRNVSKMFESRKEAEKYMWKVCFKYGVTGVECVECDKHLRAYSNHKGVRFYINRN